ncbi:hypothetical protein V6N12_050390 [Hibiscus sabdariffa]|uniref:Reverse transcriptase Ty1/copia-type domain-containing protein n=1 Tax=Hibiscus sabdariffa TaxID=183260 RepID=A0ABR2GCA1_9ROSI
MRIVLNQERKEYVIIESVPNEPGTNSPRASKDKFEKHMDDMLDVGCLVLATITLELQKQHDGKGRNIELEEVQQQQVIKPEVEGISQAVEENPTDLETQPLRRSTRERHEPERYGFLVTSHVDVILVDQDEPKTYQEAVASPDFEKWLEAMRSEMDSVSENQVWTLVEPSAGIKPIGCKWVFKKKTDMDGNVQTYKGRLVAKVAFHDYEIWQMDVKTAFLNGKLEEGVYMTQPEGFVTLENARKVCKLQKIHLWTKASFSKLESSFQRGNPRVWIHQK